MYYIMIKIMYVINEIIITPSAFTLLETVTPLTLIHVHLNPSTQMSIADDMMKFALQIWSKFKFSLPFLDLCGKCFKNEYKLFFKF